MVIGQQWIIINQLRRVFGDFIKLNISISSPERSSERREREVKHSL